MKKIELTGFLPVKITLIEDEKIGGYTIYSEEYPSVIAEGNTIDEAKRNYFELLKVVIRHKFNVLYMNFDKE